MRYGIDISRHNHTLWKKIQWGELQRFNQVAQFPIEFCFVKCGEAGMKGYPIGTFREQFAGAQGIGLQTFPYYFYRYTQGAKAQALDFYNRTTAGYRADPMLDFEDENVKMSKSFQQNLALAKLINQHVRTCVERTAELFKRKVTVYSAAWWWNWWAQLVDTSWVNNYELWVANYVVYPGDGWDVHGLEPIMPVGWARWDIWQIGSTNLPGFPTAVDLNIAGGVRK